jgi:putative FmdB family regulatory protein
MPIYGYRCSSCGLEKDVMQKISESPLTVCPSCGAPTFVKQLSAAGFQLKGSGWYATDFKGGPKTSGGGAAATGERRFPKQASSDGASPSAASSGSPTPAQPPRPAVAPAPVIDEALFHHRAADLDSAGHHDLGARVDSRHAGLDHAAGALRMAAAAVGRLRDPRDWASS